MPRQNILVFCAHSDDQIIGPGATLAKYAREGKNIYTIIFSYGEAALAWWRPEVAIKTRVKEAKKADKVIGGKGVVFFGLKENKFLEQAEERNLFKKIQKIIEEKKPVKIFTHSSEDPHPDHRAVYKIIIEALDKSKYKCDLFSFAIWNPFTFRRTHFPKMYVDITDTFKIKLKALKVFESQKITLFTILWSVYAKALIYGFQIHTRYAEEFLKIR